MGVGTRGCQGQYLHIYIICFHAMLLWQILESKNTDWYQGVSRTVFTYIYNLFSCYAVMANFRILNNYFISVNLLRHVYFVRLEMKAYFFQWTLMLHSNNFDHEVFLFSFLY